MCQSKLWTMQLAILWFCPALVALAEPQQLLLVGEEPREATLMRALASGQLQFHLGDREGQVSPEKLLRWSTPQTSGGASELVLNDGSRLVLAEAWLGVPVLQCDAESVRATTRLLGKVSFPRALLRAVLLNVPADSRQRSQWLDESLLQKEQDRLILSNGDVLTGQCLEISKAIRFAVPQASQPLKLPLSKKIAGIVIAGAPAKKQPGKMIVGLRDGSLLVAESLVVSAGQLRLQSAAGLQLTGAGLHDVVYLRSLTTRAAYLSDLQQTDYRHVPYLEIPWPFKRDRNVLGSPLTVSGKTYSKGLGMHTASRLTYDLHAAEKSFRRFAAEVALDDAARAGRGSVVFRVYLRTNGNWQLAFGSPVIRGGDAPQGVSVQLGSASQIALVTDYADHGDEQDYANWLDARLE
ncbi:MAG: NPCBM/NEW2 domain-containing protein [Pirellulales bacterium]|nr:NPCBM/NEW2 domain-containing protein [Pirellulales bacterium]